MSQPPLTDIGKFYKQISDFKEKVIRILQSYEKDKQIIEINKYYDKLSQLKKINVRSPVEIFYDNVVSKYVVEILVER